MKESTHANKELNKFIGTWKKISQTLQPVNMV